MPATDNLSNISGKQAEVWVEEWGGWGKQGYPYFRGIRLSGLKCGNC